MPDIKIIDDRPHSKFYIPIDGKKAFIKYRMRNESTIEYITTFVPEEYRGKPYARLLVEYALNYAREKKLRVVPTCPYITKFLSKNEAEYKDIQIEK